MATLDIIVDIKMEIKQSSKNSIERASVACERLTKAHEELALAMTEFREACGDINIEFEAKG